MEQYFDAPNQIAQVDTLSEGNYIMSCLTCKYLVTSALSLWPNSN